ncbi:MAG: NAD(P)H-dependent oxidoreductase [Pseudomonadota bacterium]
MTSILRIDASARHGGSITRDLADRIANRFEGAEVVTRDLSNGLPLINESWVGANFTPADDRTAEQRTALSLSDELIAEIQKADVLLIGVPIYNFGIPAALKAWVDQVARAGVTFRYTDNGPVGLLEGKRAVIAVASGGTQVGSDIDFATGYLKHVLGFIGITDVQIVSADRLMMDGENSLKSAGAQIEALSVAA